jgi:hypothetical protein
MVSSSHFNKNLTLIYSYPKNGEAYKEIGNGIWKVFYRDVFLGYFNENDIRVKQQSIRLSLI